jgi:hypothetical protein
LTQQESENQRRQRPNVVWVSMIVGLERMASPSPFFLLKLLLWRYYFDCHLFCKDECLQCPVLLTCSALLPSEGLSGFHFLCYHFRKKKAYLVPCLI